MAGNSRSMAMKILAAAFEGSRLIASYQSPAVQSLRFACGVESDVGDRHSDVIDQTCT